MKTYFIHRLAQDIVSESVTIAAGGRLRFPAARILQLWPGRSAPRPLPGGHMAQRQTRPQPRRGDWILTRGPSSRIELKFYTAPWSAGGGIQVPGRPPAPYSYLGPVHRVDQSDAFTSVLVPHPEHQELLSWMNIWASRSSDREPPLVSPRAVHFAWVVCDHELLRWFQLGWRNEFLD